jgi:hypothetical protein
MPTPLPFALSLLLGAGAAAADPSGARPAAPSAPTAGYSGNAAVGASAGILAGDGVSKGVFTAAIVRYEAYAVPVDARKPRLGVSVWGQFPMGPKPTLDLAALGVSGEDLPQSAEVELWHYGVLATIRGDPAAPVSADVAFGFGRVDLRGAPLATTALPALTGELGLRHRVRGPAQLSWTLRASWLAAPPQAALDTAAVTAPAGTTTGDWWTLQLGPSLSFRAP